MFGLMLVACSDDGVPATGTDGSTGSATTASTVSASDTSVPTTGTPTTSGPTSGTTDEPSTTEPPGSTSGVETTGGTQAETTGSGSSGETTESTSSGSGSGSESSSESTGDPIPGNACDSDDDCVLVDDCCTCQAMHVDDPTPECDIEACFQSTCSAQNIPGIDVQCSFGSCEFVPFECNPVFVACDELPPDCPDGTLPSVVKGCWGSCVPSEACDFVPDCGYCPGDETCVSMETQLGPFYFCVPVDPSCDGMPDCDCMGTVCEDPFMCGDEDDGNLSCFCPVCG